MNGIKNIRYKDRMIEYTDIRKHTPTQTNRTQVDIDRNINTHIKGSVNIQTYKDKYMDDNDI